MDTVMAKLTVYFEEPFWVGLYERTENGEMRVCRVVFGAQPKEQEVYAYFLHNFTKLRLSPPVKAQQRQTRCANAKRMQRAVHKALQHRDAGTKARQAVKLQQEQGKAERKSRRHERRETQQMKKFALRQEKKREKHRGH